MYQYRYTSLSLRSTLCVFATIPLETCHKLHITRMKWVGNLDVMSPSGGDFNAKVASRSDISGSDMDFLEDSGIAFHRGMSSPGRICMVAC